MAIRPYLSGERHLAAHDNLERLTFGSFRRGSWVEISSIVRYHTVDGSGDPDEYTLTNLKLTYRGDVRGIEQLANGTTAIMPVMVMDIDWMGRTTGSAQYTSAVTWSNVLTGDGYSDYLSSNSTNRNDWVRTYYDDWGNAYRNEIYPGTVTTNHFESNNYYDRNGQLVASGLKYNAATEYAYDGVGRQYQERSVLTLKGDQPSESFYSSGAFQYVDPKPHPTLTNMSTSQGNDGIFEFMHNKFDAGGNVTETHSFELNHDDTNGLSLTTNGKPVGGVRHSVYAWYDAVDRIRTAADFGSRDADDGYSSWAAADLPAPQSEPTASDANKLVTLFSYDAETGRLSVVTDPKGTKTKTFYDDAGRQTAVAENYVNYDAGADTGAGGGTNNEEDRVTKFAYNGLGQQTQIAAVNVTSSGTINQETQYYYQDDYDASLVTHAVYPDSSSTPTSGSDLVKAEYNLDGTLKKRTDQRGVVIEYGYDAARRLQTEAATTIPSGVDDTVQEIYRAYDSLGRLTRVLSLNEVDDPTEETVINEIKYTYGAEGLVIQSDQDHIDIVGLDSVHRTVQYSYDTSATSNVYDNGLRPKMVTYPNGRKIHTTYGSSGGIDDVLSRVRQINRDEGGEPNPTPLSEYSYNGTGRLVIAAYGLPGVLLDLYQGTSDTYAGFDRFGRVIDQKWASGVGDLARIQYTYDYAGNRLTRDASGTNAYDQAYGYDGLHRLTSQQTGQLSAGAIINPTKIESFNYDQLGNWSSYGMDGDGDFAFTGANDRLQTRTHDAANQLSTIDEANNPDWATVVHDAAGNMTVIPTPQAPASSFTMTYDAWNRLVGVDQTGQFDWVVFEYDGLHRRIVRDLADGTSDDRHYYYNDDWQLLTETLPNGTVEAIYHWHPFYIDALAVRMRASDTHFFLQDANYNVTAAVLDDGGDNVVERYSYSPYGEVTVLDANFASDGDGLSDIANQHLYTGRERDPETGLQLNRYRYYVPHLGRWLSREPLDYWLPVFKDGVRGVEFAGAIFDGSKYQYLHSNANLSLDPYGLGFWGAVGGALAGAVAGLATGAATGAIMAPGVGLVPGAIGGAIAGAIAGGITGHGGGSLGASALSGGVAGIGGGGVGAATAGAGLGGAAVAGAISGGVGQAISTGGDLGATATGAVLGGGCACAGGLAGGSITGGLISAIDEIWCHNLRELPKAWD